MGSSGATATSRSIRHELSRAPGHVGRAQAAGERQGAAVLPPGVEPHQSRGGARLPAHHGPEERVRTGLEAHAVDRHDDVAVAKSHALSGRAAIDTVNGVSARLAQRDEILREALGTAYASVDPRALGQTRDRVDAGGDLEDQKHRERAQNRVPNQETRPGDRGFDWLRPSLFGGRVPDGLEREVEGGPSGGGGHARDAA